MTHSCVPSLIPMRHDTFVLQCHVTVTYSYVTHSIWRHVGPFCHVPHTWTSHETRERVVTCIQKQCCWHIHSLHSGSNVDLLQTNVIIGTRLDVAEAGRGDVAEFGEVRNSLGSFTTSGDCTWKNILQWFQESLAVQLQLFKESVVVWTLSTSSQR